MDSATADTDSPATPPVAVVTGATAGIGAAYARALARWGNDLVLVARDESRLQAARESLMRAHGVEVRVLAADLARDEGIARVESFLEQAKGIDLLVNNAGFGTRGTLAATDAAGQHAMTMVHVVAVSRLTRAVLPAMLARKRGAIITVSSVASYLTSASNVNYCATKAYQRSAMQSLWREVRGSGVYVQALCPGYTRTEFHERAQVKMRHVPTWLWMNADEVVESSLEAMRRGKGPVVVPGWPYKLVVGAIRLAPWMVPHAANR